MGNLIDLTGQRFGKLTVIERAGSRNREALWHCKCDCGKETFSRAGSLNFGKSKSCGCARLVHLIESPTRRTHGGTGERLYKVWIGMRQRCSDPKNIKYADYGGRGICVCKEWNESYALFREWAIASGYDKTAPRGECTIDRIEVNGPYAPWNCRFANAKTQANNRRPQHPHQNRF